MNRYISNNPQIQKGNRHTIGVKSVRENPLPNPRTMELISVVIPCFGQAHYLQESVTSIAAQTHGNWEIIIVNDGSLDNTTAVVQSLMKMHPDRITLIEKSNGGLSSARNAGIRLARSEYVFLLDADDRIQPTMLEKTSSILDANPSVGFAYTEIQHFGARNDIYRLPDFDSATLISIDNIVCGHCLIRKSMWASVGGHNEAMREGYEDWDFWISCVEAGWQGFCVHEPLLCYRKTADGMLNSANKKRERLIATIVMNHPNLYDSSTSSWAREVILKSATHDAA